MEKARVVSGALALIGVTTITQVAGRDTFPMEIACSLNCMMFGMPILALFALRSPLASGSFGAVISWAMFSLGTLSIIIGIGFLAAHVGRSQWLLYASGCFVAAVWGLTTKGK